MFFHAGSFIISNIFQFSVKLNFPMEKLFLLPAGFELRALLVVAVAQLVSVSASETNSNVRCSNSAGNKQSFSIGKLI